MSRFFRKLRARTHEAKVIALSSVVGGKDVESQALLLHRELEREQMSFLFFLAFCVCFTRLQLKCQLESNVSPP